MKCDKRVLFVGECIEDVYRYGRLMNRPAKEPIQCIAFEREEIFLGGVEATSAHAMSFCDVVDVFSTVSVSKVRYLESSHNRKLFEYYDTPVVLSPTPLEPAGYDLIAACDYGHGMMTEERIEDFLQRPALKAACVQTNAGNYGFNLATKYHGLDYLCVDENEARLATQNQHGDIRRSLEKLAVLARTVCVTLGAKGAIGYRDGLVSEVPVFTDYVRDTMGAGDAFFAVTALFFNDLPLVDLLRLGNAAAAVKAQSVGQKPITREEVEALLARR